MLGHALKFRAHASIGGISQQLDFHLIGIMAVFCAALSPEKTEIRALGIFGKKRRNENNEIKHLRT